MVAAALPTPLVMKDSTITVDGTDYQGHCSSAQLVPAASQVTWQGLTPAASLTDTTTATWTLQLELAQDWSKADSFCRYLFENEGAHVPVTIAPKAGGTSFAVTAIVTPGAIGGAVNAVGTASVTLGCAGRPVPTYVPA